MIRNLMRLAAATLRFGLFYLVSIFVTAVLTIFGFRASGYSGGAMAQIIPSIRAGIELTAEFGPLLLIPSALGWWIGSVLAGWRGIAPAKRAAWQGAAAGLGAFIGLSVQFHPIPPALIGLPIGAFFGWLICCRIWPRLPAA